MHEDAGARGISTTAARKEAVPYGRRNKLQTFKRSKERAERAREANKAKLSAKAKVHAFLTRMKENNHGAMLAGPHTVKPGRATKINGTCAGHRHMEQRECSTQV